MIPYTIGDSFQSPSKPAPRSPLLKPGARVAPQSPTLHRVATGRFVPEPLVLAPTAAGPGALLQADSPPTAFSRESEPGPIPQPLFGAPAAATREHARSPRPGRVPGGGLASADQRAMGGAGGGTGLFGLDRSFGGRDGGLLLLVGGAGSGSGLHRLDQGGAGGLSSGSGSGSVPSGPGRPGRGQRGQPPQAQPAPGSGPTQALATAAAPATARRSLASAASPTLGASLSSQQQQPHPHPHQLASQPTSNPPRRGSSPSGTMPSRLSLASAPAGPSSDHGPASARPFGGGGPSRFLLTVVPPLHLPHDPPHPRTSGACSGYGPPSQFR